MRFFGFFFILCIAIVTITKLSMFTPSFFFFFFHFRFYANVIGRLIGRTPLPMLFLDRLYYILVCPMQLAPLLFTSFCLAVWMLTC